MVEDEERPPDRVFILKTVMIAHAKEPAERELVPLDLERWQEVVEACSQWPTFQAGRMTRTVVS